MLSPELAINISRQPSSRELTKSIASRARSDLREIGQKIKGEKDNRPEQPLERATANLEFIESLRTLDSVNAFLQSTQRPIKIFTHSYSPFEEIGMFVFSDGAHDARVEWRPIGFGKVLRVWSLKYSEESLKFTWKHQGEYELPKDILFALADMKKADIVKKFQKAIR